MLRALYFRPPLVSMKAFRQTPTGEEAEFREKPGSLEEPRRRPLVFVEAVLRYLVVVVVGENVRCKSDGGTAERDKRGAK